MGWKDAMLGCAPAAGKRGARSRMGQQGRAPPPPGARYKRGGSNAHPKNLKLRHPTRADRVESRIDKNVASGQREETDSAEPDRRDACEPQAGPAAQGSTVGSVNFCGIGQVIIENVGPDVVLPGIANDLPVEEADPPERPVWAPAHRALASRSQHMAVCQRKWGAPRSERPQHRPHPRPPKILSIGESLKKSRHEVNPTP